MTGKVPFDRRARSRSSPEAPGNITSRRTRSTPPSGRNRHISAPFRQPGDAVAALAQCTTDEHPHPVVVLDEENMARMGGRRDLLGLRHHGFLRSGDDLVEHEHM